MVRTLAKSTRIVLYEIKISSLIKTEQATNRNVGHVKSPVSYSFSKQQLYFYCPQDHLRGQPPSHSPLTIDLCKTQFCALSSVLQPVCKEKNDVSYLNIIHKSFYRIVRERSLISAMPCSFFHSYYSFIIQVKLWKMLDI